MSYKRALSWPFTTATVITGIIVVLPLAGVRSRWLPSLWNEDDIRDVLPRSLPPQAAWDTPVLPDLSRQNRAALLQEPMPAHLTVPVSGVPRLALRDSFGAPRSGGRRHEGIDIFAPHYTPVVAATPGFILQIGTNHLGGNIVKVLGPGGYIHYYAHLSAYGPIHVHDWVQAGDVIGYVGNTGDARTKSTHLHYGIYAPTGWHAYHAIDPYPFLAGTSAAEEPQQRFRLPALR